MRDLLYNALLPLGTRLSLAQLHAIGAGLGRLLWVALPRRRRETIVCVQERLDLPMGEARRVARGSFIHTANAFLEIFHTRQVGPRFLQASTEFENPDLFARMSRSNRPVVATTAHLGSWELLVGMIGGFASTSTCQVVVRLPKDKELGELIVHMRSQPRIRILPHRDAATQTLSHLRAGGAGAFLVDHNCSKAEAEFLPFLGKVAAVNKGPAILALRAKAEVWPVFLLRLPHGRFRMVTLPPLDTVSLSGDRGERIRSICRFYTQAVESMVQRYPEQWFWMHRRWKTRP